MFGSRINSTRVQKQFCFQKFSFKFCFEFELDSTRNVISCLLIYQHAKYGNFWSNIRVVFPIYNSVQFGKFKINCYRVGVTTVCPLSQTGSRHFQIPNPGPHVSHPEQRNLAHTTYSLVRLNASIRRRP
jgi:hypothetical protein